MLSLSEMPRRCPTAPEAEKLGEQMRQLLYGRRSGVYRIIFRIEEEPEPVARILAIRHGARECLDPEDLK